MCMSWKCFVIFISLTSISESRYGFVHWKYNRALFSECENLSEIPKDHIARGTFRNKINDTGWAFLEIHTVPEVADEKQAYAAGFIEGFLTRDLIWMHWQNMLKGYCFNKIKLCQLIEDFLDKNEEYIDIMVREGHMDPYWYQVKLYYTQIEGLAMGYNAATKDQMQLLTVRDIGWINLLGDLDELAFSLSLPKELPDDLLFGSHCTGLVKLLPDLSNLYTAHTTWNSYQSMLRIQKMYVLHYRQSSINDAKIPGYKMSLTSYPAFVQVIVDDDIALALLLRRGHSVSPIPPHVHHDFYILSSGLVVAETTISNSNRTLFSLIKPDGVVMEYIRGMIACRLATDGQSWTNIFRGHNSGTYNNQWYIVDYNKFKPRSSSASGYVKKGLLWIVEQLPGYTEAADMTNLLVTTSYFPSFNIPFFPKVFNMSGGNERVATFGEWFGYDTNPRAAILRKMQAKITNLRSMYNTMRYNDFKYDPLSRCEQCSPPYSACNAIAARNDLNPANGTYPFRALGHRSHGATDTKVTSAYLRGAYLFVAISSPPHNISRGIPPFAWSEFDLGPQLMHMGHPDVWTFQPLIHRWEWD